MYSLIARLPPGIRLTAVYALSLAAMKGVSFVMLPVFTHYLTPEEYGRLDILQTLADLLSIVLAMGLADTLFRFAGNTDSEAERRDAAATVAGIGLISAIVFLIVGQILAPVIAALLPGDASPVHVRLILASLSLTTAILIPLAWLRMNNRAGWYASGTLGRVSLQAMLAAFFLWQGFGVTGVLVAGLAGASLLAGSLTFVQWRDTGLRLPRGREFSTLMRYAMPLIAAGAAGFVLRSSDRWFVADALGPAGLADYALAQKLGLLTLLIIQPFEMWWLSQRFSALKTDGGKARAARTATLGLALCIVAALMVAAVGPSLTIVMTPAAYHGAVLFLPWLAALAALHAATTVMNLGLYTGDTTYLPLLIEVITAALALLLFWFFVPAYGAFGAIAAAGIALTCRFAAVCFLAQKRLALPFSWITILGIMGVGVAGVVVIAQAASTGHALLAGTAATMLIGLLVFRIFRHVGSNPSNGTVTVS